MSMTDMTTSNVRPNSLLSRDVWEAIRLYGDHRKHGDAVQLCNDIEFAVLAHLCDLGLGEHPSVIEWKAVLERVQDARRQAHLHALERMMENLNSLRNGTRSVIDKTPPTSPFVSHSIESRAYYAAWAEAMGVRK